MKPVEVFWSCFSADDVNQSCFQSVKVMKLIINNKNLVQRNRPATNISKHLVLFLLEKSVSFTIEYKANILSTCLIKFNCKKTNKCLTTGYICYIIH